MADGTLIYEIPDRKDPVPFDTRVEWIAISLADGEWLGMSERERQALRDTVKLVDRARYEMPIEMKMLNQWAHHPIPTYDEMLENAAEFYDDEKTREQYIKHKMPFYQKGADEWREATRVRAWKMLDEFATGRGAARG